MKRVSSTGRLAGYKQLVADQVVFSSHVMKPCVTGGAIVTQTNFNILKYLQ